MFVNMGALTYSEAVVDFRPGKLVVKSAQYDPDLGGRDFDYVIAEWIATRFEEKYWGKLSGRPKVMLKLYAAAKKAKQTLSPVGVNVATINLECLMDNFNFNVSLRADEYKAMCQPLLAHLAGPIKQALLESKLDPANLSSVEIVGGATRVGSIKEALLGILHLNASAVNNSLSTTMNADEAVARGCALQSAILLPRFKVLLYEVIESQAFPIKIEWDGSSRKAGMEVDNEGQRVTLTNLVIMFERGCNFPIVRRVTLRRSGKFTAVAMYGETANNYNFWKGAAKKIAIFWINAPPNADCKIRVNVKQDIHGLLTLSLAHMVEEVTDTTTAAPGAEEQGEEAKASEGEVVLDDKDAAAKKVKIKKTNLWFTIVRPPDWTETELQREIEVEVDMTNADRIVGQTADTRTELESYIYNMCDKIVLDISFHPPLTNKFGAQLIV